MNFSLSADHLALRDAAAAFLDREVSLAPLLVPGAGATAFDRDALWRKAAALGWPALVIPEHAGGLGMELIELAMIIGETGRTLAPLALYGTLAGAWTIMAAGSREQQTRLLGRVADGSYRLALAMADRRGNGAANAGMIAQRDAGLFRLRGDSCFVVDAPDADKIVTVAMLDGVARIFVVEAREPGALINEVAWRDTTRRVATVVLDGAVGEMLDQPWVDVWPYVRDRLYLLLAAESAAGSRAALSDAVTYALQRRTFGKLIGQHQAIKHQLAELAGQIELADVGVQYAAWALDHADRHAAALAAAAAQSYASDTYRQTTYRNIQVFGAIGFTWEMRNHLHYKRARCNAVLLGDSTQQQEEVVCLLERAAAVGATVLNSTNAPVPG